MHIMKINITMMMKIIFSLLVFMMPFLVNPNKTSKTFPKKTKIELDQIKFEEDLYHLSSIIHSEGGVTDQEEKTYIASVVYNRWNKISPIDSVISSEGQFDGYCDHNYYPEVKSQAVAYLILKGKKVIPKIKYFYNPVISTDSVFVAWAETQKRVKLDYHYFF